MPRKVKKAKRVKRKINSKFRKGLRRQRSQTVTLKFAYGGNPDISYVNMTDSSVYALGGLVNIPIHPSQHTATSITDKFFAIYEQWRIKAVRLHLYYTGGRAMSNLGKVIASNGITSQALYSQDQQPRVFVLDVSRQYISRVTALRATDIIHHPKSVRWYPERSNLKTFYHGRPYCSVPAALAIDTPNQDFTQVPTTSSYQIQRDNNWRYKSQWANYEMPWLKLVFISVGSGAPAQYTYLPYPIAYDIEYVVEFRNESDLITGDALFKTSAMSAAAAEDLLPHPDDGEEEEPSGDECETEEESSEDEPESDDEKFIESEHEEELPRKRQSKSITSVSSQSQSYG